MHSYRPLQLECEHTQFYDSAVKSNTEMLLTIGYYNRQVGINVHNNVFDTKNQTYGGCYSTEINRSQYQSGFYISTAHFVFLVHYIA
jgi:hypothetical protein